MPAYGSPSLPHPSSRGFHSLRSIPGGVHYQRLILIVIEYLASDQVRDKGFDPSTA